MKLENKIFNADCLDALPKIPDNSINLIITSPPYAEKRKKELGYVS